LPVVPAKQAKPVGIKGTRHSLAPTRADPSYANEVLGWKALESIDDTLRSSWKWQLKLREREGKI
jgi:UDP-glucose 4-epimerase